MSIMILTAIIRRDAADQTSRCARGQCRWFRIAIIHIVTVFILLGVSEVAFAAGFEQETFATPQRAVDSLVAAVRESNRHEMLRILGPQGAKLIFSGDRVADSEGRRKFVSAYDAAHRLDLAATDKAVLIIGKDAWPFPIPVVKQGDVWRFDTGAGMQEILNRRIGRNELNVIEVCRAYVDAQREYATMTQSGNGMREYAQRFKSSPGKHDGLYWSVNTGQKESPFGPLVGSATEEGYTGGHHRGRRSPYHGYYYKILKRQGRNAPGGAKDYVVKGHMTGGFGLLAFPAKWGDSGVMTFIVNQDGIVFEKNLGPDTAEITRHITGFDPDLTWKAP
ncbi:MAG: DUF2950 domain-containing protein [Acidiferrobacterales bacterium]